MRLQLAEHPRSLAHPVAEDARHRQRGVVVQDRARHLAEERECGVVPVAERFGSLRRISPYKTRVAVRQVDRKKVDLAFDLPHSNACFVRAYPAETAEAFCDGHNAAIRALRQGARARYCTTTPRWRWRASSATGCASEHGCSASCSRGTCLPSRGRPGKGNDKGKRGADRLDSPQPAGAGAAGRRLGSAQRAAARGLSPSGGGGSRQNDRRTAGARYGGVHALPRRLDACEKKAGRVSSRSWCAIAAPTIRCRPPTATAR